MLSIISGLLFTMLMSSGAVNISLELIGNCSPEFTLVCRHLFPPGSVPEEVYWFHNNSVGKNLKLPSLEDAFPEAGNYTWTNSTEHRFINAINSSNYDGYKIACKVRSVEPAENRGSGISNTSHPIRGSNGVFYTYAPADYQPTLELKNTDTNDLRSNASVIYAVKNCIPGCVELKTGIEPGDNVTINEKGTDCNRTVELSQLQRCQDYSLGIFSASNTELLTLPLTAPPGDFAIDYCFAQAGAGHFNLTRINLRNLEPGCPDFADETYRVEVDGKMIANLSARSIDHGINGVYQLDISPAYTVSENAIMLRVTRLRDSGTGETKSFYFPCVSSGSSQTVYSLSGVLALLMLALSSG